MKYEVATLSNCGFRENNEDDLRVVSLENATAVILSDGLGGYEGGEVASETAVDTIEKCFCLSPFVTEENITNILMSANENVLDLHTDGAKMRATIVAVFMDEERMIVAHAGDSRCYLFSKWKILYKTRDHSVSQLAVDMGELKAKDMAKSPDRNKVLRSLGTKEFKADIHTISVPRDEIRGILLCTDGLWEKITDQQLVRIFRWKKTAEQCKQKLIQLVEKQKDAKQDNYSAIIMR